MKLLKLTEGLDDPAGPSTIGEWLMCLPEDIAVKAIANCQLLNEKAASLPQALQYAFVWNDTAENEGHEFWYSVYQDACNGVFGAGEPHSLSEAASGAAFLTAKERKQISNVLHRSLIFSGHQKVAEPRDAISPLAEALRSVGFTLDMVAGDILMGPKGSRQLPFRRTHPEPYEEYPRIENSVISFTWEEVGPQRTEIIAYVS